MEPLPRLELGPAVTGVGSLPCLDAEEAIEWVRRRAPRLPFCPQLPRQGEGAGMIDALLGEACELLLPGPWPGCWELPRRGVGRFREALARPPRPTASTRALEGELLRALRAGAFPRARALKLQIAGPVTLAAALRSAGRSWAEHPAGLAASAQRVRAEAERLRRRFLPTGLPLVLVLDEPVLGAGLGGNARAPLRACLGRVLQQLAPRFARVGIHVCAPVLSRTLLELGAGWISFDASRAPRPTLGRELARFVDRGGFLVPGLVPTWSDPNGASTAPAAALAALWPGHELPPRARLVTATCGLGLLDEDSARATFRRGEEILRAWRSPPRLPATPPRPPPPATIVSARAWVVTACALLGVPCTPPSTRRAERELEPKDATRLEIEVLRLAHRAGVAARGLEIVSRLRARRAHERFRGAEHELEALRLEEGGEGRGGKPPRSSSAIPPAGR